MTQSSSLFNSQYYRRTWEVITHNISFYFLTAFRTREGATPSRRVMNGSKGIDPFPFLPFPSPPSNVDVFPFTSQPKTSVTLLSYAYPLPQSNTPLIWVYATALFRFKTTRKFHLDDSEFSVPTCKKPACSNYFYTTILPFVFDLYLWHPHLPSPSLRPFLGYHNTSPYQFGFVLA